MIIRVIVKNLFSFNNEIEFNTLPWRISRLGHHKYSRQNIDILKLSAIYGANGAGKSNLIKAISLLKNFVSTGVIPNELKTEKFKLNSENKSLTTEIGIEFLSNDIAYFYVVEIDNIKILSESLFKSGLGKKDDEVIFQRETDINGKVLIKFNAEFEKTTENKTLIAVIQKDLAKPEKPVLKLLSGITNEGFNDCRSVTNWFNKKLRVILPDSFPIALANRIDKEVKFKDFANDLLASFNTGISIIGAEVIPLDELLEDQKNLKIEGIKNDLLANPKKLITINLQGVETVLVNENGTINAKKLYLEHLNDKKEPIKFRINEESNGTARLIEYIPAIQDIIKTDAVYVIDEIERSIHPLAIKELISKFSIDEMTKGQLIFSTHECNLLDQDLLRQDEIWFAEKNATGATELYPLSEFKEHHTIDIRKGYLNGRYGAIPFLGNLKDLNWHKYEGTN